ncbi:MAG: SDR family NAD(P)-dependent oxidoreductase [Armatimonadota bacterium]|nr:SDR family NAD(P)-dependent oxidoreductase [Armatimonadota bacterium]
MSDRTVIVTGASSGIGEAAARAFGQAGDRVVLAARRVDRLEALATTLPESLVVPADLTIAADAARVVEAAAARFGGVDVLVNNAGLGRYDWYERLSDEDILGQVQVNLLAPMLLIRAVLPIMLRQRRGVIINVCSVAGKIATPTTAIYNATKFGLDGLNQALRRELLSRGIHVCIVYPGPTAGSEFGAKARRVRMRGAGLPWLRTTTDRVARAIVDMADRPRARRVLPWVYAPMITINHLAPGLVDWVVARAVAGAQVAVEQ